MLDVLHRFLDNGKSLQAQEVHLDQAGIFNHRAFILGYQHLFAGFLIVCRTYRHPIRNIITTNNGTTSMHTCIADIAFQHLGITNGITQDWIRRRLSLLQFRHIFDSICQVHLLATRQTVWDSLTQTVGFRQRQLLHTGYVLDS